MKKIHFAFPQAPPTRARQPSGSKSLEAKSSGAHRVIDGLDLEMKTEGMKTRLRRSRRHREVHAHATHSRRGPRLRGPVYARLGSGGLVFRAGHGRAHGERQNRGGGGRVPLPYRPPAQDTQPPRRLPLSRGRHREERARPLGRGALATGSAQDAPSSGQPAHPRRADEPLDLTSKDVLLEALKSFSGTVLFVSHDRLFIEELADRVLELEDVDDPDGTSEIIAITSRRRHRSRTCPGMMSEVPSPRRDPA